MIVPVKDEADDDSRYVARACRQYDLSGRPFDHTRYEVLLLCNNCTDEISLRSRGSSHGNIRHLPCTLSNGPFLHIRQMSGMRVGS